MKQALGWLMAAVVAAGLNASYHDGGLQTVHRAFARASYDMQAVLALATGRADQFMTEARMVSAQDERPSCPFSTALARVQTKFAQSEGGFDRFEAMSAREEAQLARLEANRARIAAKLVRVRIPAVAFNPVVIKAPVVSAPVCPRVRVSIPRIPMVKAPIIHLEAPGMGPV